MDKVTHSLLIWITILSIYGGKLTSAQSISPQTYPMSFMNITTDRSEECVIQIYAYAINKTQMILQYNNQTYNNIQYASLQASVDATPANTYNISRKFSSLVNEEDPANGDPVNNLAIIGAASGFIYLSGVRSDLGTTGVYTALPVVDTSKEFFIAGWEKYLNFPFIVEIQVIAAQDGTCIEVYKIFNGTKYMLVGSNNTNMYQVYRYFPTREIAENGTQLNIGEDCTGYYVNCSKPCQVIFGHECAWVPDTTILYCDYITEQIPPLSQLGKRHVAPPIPGRSPQAGYVVRVVATVNNTTITYLNESVTLMKGQFIQFEQPVTNVATLVVCSENCLVMQYNKGFLAANEESDGSDPYMSLVSPDDRFTSSTGLATPNFCDGPEDLIDFNNFVSIVTFPEYTSLMMFDDSPISNALDFTGWEPVPYSNGAYVTTTFWVPHGFHFISCSTQPCSFSGTMLGHSLDMQSTSAYANLMNYNITGTALTQAWTAAAPLVLAATGNNTGTGCSSPDQMTGQIVSNNQYASFPFTLRAEIDPSMGLSPSCLALYNNTLTQLLETFSSMINTWICTTQNCSYLGGVGVAINYNTLGVTFLGSDNMYWGVQIDVEMIASFTTTAQNFAQCRADIMNYMVSFVNWPPNYSQNLIPQIAGSGCPWPPNFVQPMFTSAPQQCPTDYSSYSY